MKENNHLDRRSPLSKYIRCTNCKNLLLESLLESFTDIWPGNIHVCHPIRLTKMLD